MSFGLWVTETGQEWKTGRRLGISHRQRAEKGNMATHTTSALGGLVLSFVRCALWGAVKGGG